MLTRNDRRHAYKAIEATRLRRVKNLRRLQDLFGSTAELARHLGKAPSFVTAICGPNPRREIGEVLARDIENALKLTTGWLDAEHG